MESSRADTRDGGRDQNSREAGAALERAVADGCDGGRDQNIREAGAALERVVADGYDRVWYRQRGHTFAARERVGADGFDAVWNLEGFRHFRALHNCRVFNRAGPIPAVAVAHAASTPEDRSVEGRGLSGARSLTDRAPGYETSAKLRPCKYGRPGAPSCSGSQRWLRTVTLRLTLVYDVGPFNLGKSK
jgi:hypothetical protein